MSHNLEIGRRALARIEEVCPGQTHRQIARAIDMTPDALSRALAGKRAFSSIELARLAELLQADVHWMITGEPDPHRLIAAARHDFDPETGRRRVPGREQDEALLRDVGLAYRQAYAGTVAPPSRLPASVGEVRRLLGEDFVRPFADRLEFRLGVDVVRLPGLSTSYCFTVGGRQVIVVAATGNWFWENWSIAHELGHLVAGHLAVPVLGDEQDAHEAEANAFAADLLLPAEALQAMDWRAVGAEELAARVWDLGVSVKALATRLSSLGVPFGPEVARWAGQPTQRLLRRHWAGAHPPEGDPITQRMDDAAGRRFPFSLQQGHLAKIASGELGKSMLAWMLGIDPDDLEVDAPALPDAINPGELASALGL